MVIPVISVAAFLDEEGQGHHQAGGGQRGQQTAAAAPGAGHENGGGDDDKGDQEHEEKRHCQHVATDEAQPVATVAARRYVFFKI